MKKRTIAVMMAAAVAVSGCAGQGGAGNAAAGAGQESGGDGAGAGQDGAAAGQDGAAAGQDGAAAGTDDGQNGAKTGRNGAEAGQNGPGGETSAGGAAVRDAAELFSDRDFETDYEESESAAIQLNGDLASCSSGAVQISGSTVTITDEGTYVLSGTLDDGMIIVNADKSDKVHLVLNGVAIHSGTSAPIYILQADKVFLTLAEGTENTLSHGGTFTAIDENKIDGVIFSKEDLTLNGTGTLAISSPAGHGIVSKDSLRITGGTYEIDCASHGLSGKDDVCIADGSFTIVSGKDGIHGENEDDGSLGFVYIQNGAFSITAEGDGISASADLQIVDGSFEITAGGGSENGESHASDFRGGGMGGGRPEDGGMGGGRPEDGSMDRGRPENGGDMERGGEAHGAEGQPRGDRGGRGGADGSGAEADRGGEAADGGGRADGSGAAEERAGGPENRSGNMAARAGDAGEPADRAGAEANQAGSPESQSGEMADGAGASGNAADAGDSTSTKGLKAAGNLIISGGTFAINAADDGIHSNASVTINSGTFEIASGDDGGHADDTLTVADGTILITESYEGLEGLHVAVSGGEITLTADDDGLNAAGGTDASGNGGRDGRFGPGNASSDGTIRISGGTLDITASGDGIDANGTLEITDGSITITGPTQGDTSTLDYDISGTISGGTFIGTGAAAMAQSFSSAEQGVLFVNVGNQSQGTEITLADGDGNVLLTHTPELEFAVVILSSPDILTGGSYTLTAGSFSETVEAE